MKKYFQQIWATPKIHGFVQAIGSGIGGAITPFLYSAYNAVTTQTPYQAPSLKLIVIAAAGGAFAGAFGYAQKQGWIGSSNITPPVQGK